MSKVYLDDLEIDCAILEVPERQDYRKQEFEYFDEHTNIDKTGSGGIRASISLGIYDTNHRIIAEQIQQICETRNHIFLRTDGVKLIGDSNEIIIIQTRVGFGRTISVPKNYTIVNLSYIAIGKVGSTLIREKNYVRIISQENDWDVV